MTGGNRHVVVRTRRIALRVERRTAVVACALTAVLAVLGAIGLMIGDYGLTPAQALRALAGSGDGLAAYFVQEQRAPRVALAVLVGAALGVSGGVFQQLSGNPLGSPDIVGFTTGSATGALVAIVWLGRGADATGPAAIAGGMTAALVIGGLSRRDGVIAGTRLVLVGIGVAAVLQAVNSLLVVRADLSAAQEASQWLAGSFNAGTWTDVSRLAVVMAPALLVTARLARHLPALGLGDDIAVALGVRVEPVRLGLVVCGVLLVAAATGAAGPIAFVALAAPQLARRLTRTGGGGLATAALMGATVTLASDLAAQRLFAPTQLPVGVVSGSLGGVYLIWLLTRDRRTAL